MRRGGARISQDARTAKRPGLDPFALLCRAHGLPEPNREYQFAPPRKFKFDWAFRLCLVAVEQEGAIWTSGRHTRGKGYLRDMEKYNLAALLGWRVFRFTPQQIEAGEPIPLLKRVLIPIMRAAE